MSLYNVSGTDVYVLKDGLFENSLKAGVYSVEIGMFGVYLSSMTEFEKPEGRLYGGVEKRVDRIVQTFNSRADDGKSTGALLVGDKGSGKTMLTRMVSMTSGLPTIIVGSNFVKKETDNVDALVKFIMGIDDRVIVLFDEFEKNFDDKAQEKLLSLFDGVNTKPKLFLVTANNEYRINQFILNRPGRMYYRFSYCGLDKDTIREYLQDNLIDSSIVDKTTDDIDCIFKNTFSYDMISSLVEEMNRFGLGFKEAAEFLNIDVRSTNYKVELYAGNKLVGQGQTNNLDYISVYDKKKKENISFDAGDRTRDNGPSMTFTTNQYDTEYVAKVMPDYVSFDKKSTFWNAV